jgi:hypothetical protein
MAKRSISARQYRQKRHKERMSTEMEYRERYLAKRRRQRARRKKCPEFLSKYRATQRKSAAKKAANMTKTEKEDKRKRLNILDKLRRDREPRKTYFYDKECQCLDIIGCSICKSKRVKERELGISYKDSMFYKPRKPREKKPKKKTKKELGLYLYQQDCNCGHTSTCRVCVAKYNKDREWR